MDALKLLKEDHNKVKKLFAQVESLGDRAAAQRKKLFGQIDKELTIHAQVEETIFYPEFKRRADKGDEREEVLEAYEEHALVKELLGQLEDLDPKEETYKAKLSVLKDLVDHHVKEEEGPMFKTARQIFERGELDEIGDRIMAEKKRAGAA